MEILSVGFFQNALLASVLVSISCGIMGVYVVINRMVFLSGGIAHGSYGGVGMALFLGLAPLLGAGLFALFLALIIGLITLKNRSNTDTIIGGIWAFGMAVGIVFTDLTPGYNVDLMSYLFGGILAVSSGDLWSMGIVDFIIISSVIVFYHQLQAMSFDIEFSAIRGVRVNMLYFLLLVLIALCIVISVRAVGLILVIALLSISPLIAQMFARHLHSMIILSVILGMFFCLSGLFISYYLNLSPGACIIIIATSVFFLSIAYKKLLLVTKNIKF